MKTFAIISEGITDQAVIENILVGCFAQEVEPLLNPVPLAGLGGGWALVLKALREEQHIEALESNDYLVVQVDTDVSEEPGFDVPHRDGANMLDPPQLVARVRERLVQLMGEAFCAQNAARIIFAIAVDEVECWLLPLLFTNKKRAATNNCLYAANQELKRRNEHPLSTGKEDETKHVRRYDEVSKPYRKRARLLACSPENPSLAIFVDRLRDIPIELAPEE